MRVNMLMMINYNLPDRYDDRERPWTGFAKMEDQPTTQGLPANDYKYWAFISYSHADEEWAKWLHKSLETYSIPGKLVGRSTSGEVPKRLFPIFRDRDELPGASDLGGKLKEALTQSR